MAPFGRIDYDKCVSCGMCLVNCPFGAIADKSQIDTVGVVGVKLFGHHRPGGAAGGGHKGQMLRHLLEKILGLLVNCPFGAIADKSQIFQVIRAIQSGERVYAAAAPAQRPHLMQASWSM